MEGLLMLGGPDTSDFRAVSYLRSSSRAGDLPVPAARLQCSYRIPWSKSMWVMMVAQQMLVEERVTLWPVEFAFIVSPFPEQHGERRAGRGSPVWEWRPCLQLFLRSLKTSSQASKTTLGLKIMRCFRKWTWSSLSWSFVSKPFECTCFMSASLLSASSDGRSIFFQCKQRCSYTCWFQHLGHKSSKYCGIWRELEAGHTTLNFKPCFCWVIILCTWKLKACKRWSIRTPCWWSWCLPWQRARSPRDTLNFLYSLAYF